MAVIHIAGGGSSYADALRKSQIDIKIEPSREKCLWVITDYYKKVSEAEEEKMSKDEFQKYLFQRQHGEGGTIIFSTDVNVNVVEDPGIASWLTGKFHTFKNRFSFKKMLDKIRSSHQVNAWTIGQYFKGVYTSKEGDTYNENSLTIDILDCDRKTLFELTKDIQVKFKQESVMIRDATTNQYYLVDAN